MQDLRLGIKSSFNGIRNSIALLYCIFRAGNKNAVSNYGVAFDNQQKLSQDILDWIHGFLNSNAADEYIYASKLINSQIEAIQVCLELVFGLGKVSFNNATSNLSERTGKNRYPKRITFSSNMLILDAILSSFPQEDLKEFILSWLQNKESTKTQIDNAVCLFLTHQTERCILKMRFKTGNDLIFQQEGIYEVLSKGQSDVNVSDDEKVGTYRVLNSFINENLHTYLVNSKNGITLKQGITKNDIAQYLTEVSTSLDLYETRVLTEINDVKQTKYDFQFLSSNGVNSSVYIGYTTAMRTKPFLLFAGISGTGKSRIVKQLAFESCPDIEALRKDPTSPGNYELIEVKPNWHDSTEVLGYESEIGTPHYVLTPFVKFLVKAMLYEDKAPFFVCMDEMNLAPVEQYFAEFLSVLESRKLIDGKITSEPLIKADIFVQYEDQLLRDLFNLPKENMSGYNNATQDLPVLYGEFNAVYEKLKAEGLRIPSNLIVVGTVNMDETTHQFSRKVIDRAMTIEMNIEDAEKPFQDFFNGSDALHYYDSPQSRELFLPKVVQAADALTELKKEDAKYLKDNVPQLLFKLNQALDGTPFKIAYRVQNELVLYFYALRQEQPEANPEALLVSAIDAILMMKVLPRIEGDEDLLEKPLKALAEFTAAYPQASKKVAEMQQRLPQAHFTSFWP